MSEELKCSSGPGNFVPDDRASNFEGRFDGAGDCPAGDFDRYDPSVTDT